jgi:hypothetical protein
VTHSLLASLARLVTEASALDVTLSRVAVLLREAIPFERLRVLRLDRADAVALYAIDASGEIDITGHLIGDAASAAADAADRAERSRLICTIRQGARVKGGGLWLTSSTPDAFTEAHQELLEAVGGPDYAGALSRYGSHDRTPAARAYRCARPPSADGGRDTRYPSDFSAALGDQSAARCHTTFWR